MSWFHREPPPPPPKKGIPGWVNIVTPIIFAIVIGLLTIVYNGLAEELKTKADKEATLQQIQSNQKILEKHQMSLDQTLQVITKIQAERDVAEKLRKEMAPPAGFKMMEPATTVQKVTLTPGEFQNYLKMSPTDRVKYKKYLESTGKDVSGLPD